MSIEEFNSLMQELGARVRIASNPETARILLASWQPPGSAEQDQGIQDYLRWCQPLNRCISLPGDGSSFGLDARRAVALNIALDSVWPGVVEALGGLTDIRQLETMVVATLVAYLALLVVPEPVSKVIAAQLTYLIVGYVGVTTLFKLVEGWQQLSREVNEARSFGEVSAAGGRFGARIGAQLARVMVMLVTWRLGGTRSGAAPEMTLPGASTASRMMAMESGGVRLPTTSAVRSVALGMSRVTVAFSSDTVVVAGRSASQMQRQTEGEPANRPPQRPSRNVARVPAAVAQSGEERAGDCRWNHIATDKNEESDVRGGPWTPLFQLIFDRVGMSLNDPANLVCVSNHKGPHPEEYHQDVFRRLNEAMEGCDSTQQCREKLALELHRLAGEVVTPGTRLNQLVTRTASP